MCEMAQVQCYPTGHQQQSLTSHTRGRIIDTIMFLISIQSSSYSELVQTILLQTFSNDLGKILPSTNILKDASKVAANGLLMHSLEKSEGVCCKTLQRGKPACNIGAADSTESCFELCDTQSINRSIPKIASIHLCAQDILTCRSPKAS